MNILGCYAQTELGHGSNVQGLETTATFDRTKNEFVLNTPSLRATKFWPGGLGIQATHALVFAILVIDDYPYGPQPFVVPIRSLENHHPLPGIDVGDIGTKMGYNSTDNGYISFNQVRIPKANMLSRFTGIDDEGNFEIRGDLRSLYMTMVATRVSILW